MMEFLISNKAKKKAKKIRIKNERKWRYLRLLSILFLVITIISFVMGIFIIPYNNYAITGVCGGLFSIGLILYVVVRALLSNLTSHWITTRLNERIWIEDNTLKHFIQTAFAAGINSRRADERGYLFVMDIDSIHDAKYDEKSRRIEFKAFGKGYHFSDVYKNRIDKEWELKEFPAVFYDYTEPSLVSTLENQGIQFKRGTLDFLIRDGGI